jgi:hypothetical protein
MKRYTAFMVLASAVTLVLFAGSVIAAPAATGAKRPLLEGTTVTFVPWVNDPNTSDTFTFHVLTQPSNGTASAVNNHQELQYAPNSGFTGTDSFTYRAKDQAGNLVKGTARFRVYDGTDSAGHTSALTKCTRIGTVNDGSNGTVAGTIGVRTKSNDCTFYSFLKTRVLESATAAAVVTMDFFVNWPSDPGNPPKGVVVLIGGGDLNMSFAKDTTQGPGVPLETGGGNFVVRTAQIFAQAGYLTIAINKPSDQPPSGTTCSTSPPDPCEEAADQYRVSVNHAVDILKVLKHFNTQNLPVFLAGTSRGAISAVALNLIAAGVSLSSPVTNNSDDSAELYVGDSSVAKLATTFVQRPAHVLYNMSDTCLVSVPTDSQALAGQLAGASSDGVSGGVRVSMPGNGLTSSDISPCGAFDYHGYFGIETATDTNTVNAVGKITAWLDGRVSALVGDVPPKAPFKTINTAPGTIKHADLANLTGSQSGFSWGFLSGLSNDTTSLGGSVSIIGSKVTYTPPTGASNTTDYYVYFVTDGSGGVGAGVITVKIGN